MSSESPVTPWELTVVMLPKTLIDGTRRSGPLMVRKVNGVREYRAMTPDEEHEHVSQDAW